MASAVIEVGWATVYIVLRGEEGEEAVKNWRFSDLSLWYFSYVFWCLFKSW